MGCMKRAKLSVTVGMIGLAIGAMGAVGCVGGGSKGLSAEEKDKLKPYVLDAPPANIPHPIDVNFENKIHLIGYKFDPETAKPGADVKMTYWWRCDEPLDAGWALFTHLHDETSDKSDNLDWNGPLREEKNKGQALGPDKWEKGKIYVDEQTYKMPDWLKGPDLTVLVGIWKGDARLRIVSGPNDGDNRSPIGKIKTGLTAGATPPDQHTSTEVPHLNANKLAAGDKIVIDGKADDKAWGVATSTGPFVDVLTGKPNTTFPVNATAKITWDDTNLYVLYEVTEPEVVGYFTSKDKQPKDWTVSGQPKLWTKDTVELMVDPDGDNRDYYEMQVNPQNKQFHSRYDSYNLPKTEPDGPFGHEDWNPKITSAVVVKGPIDKPGTKDGGYTVEMAIPWASFDKATNHPPKPFESWRINLYAMKNNSGVAWSPIMGQGNFHKASRFGKVSWTVPGMTPPAASATAAPALQDGGAPFLAGRRIDGGPMTFRPHGMRPGMFPRVPPPAPPH
jgi:hypothetical protein